MAKMTNNEGAWTLCVHFHLICKRSEVKMNCVCSVRLCNVERVDVLDDIRDVSVLFQCVLFQCVLFQCVLFQLCRQLDFAHPGSFSAIAALLAPQAAAMPADELPSVLWAVARVLGMSQQQPDDGATLQPTDSSTVSIDRQQVQQQGGNDEGVHEGLHLSSQGSNKGLQAHTVDELLSGAATALGGNLGELENEEISVVVQALADLHYQQPVLLNALSGESAASLIATCVQVNTYRSPQPSYSCH